MTESLREEDGFHIFGNSRMIGQWGLNLGILVGGTLMTSLSCPPEQEVRKGERYKEV